MTYKSIIRNERETWEEREKRRKQDIIKRTENAKQAVKAGIQKELFNQR